MTNEIKKIMKLRKMTQVELAKKLGIKQDNLNHQFKRDNFRINDLQKIAEILNCEFKAFFVLKDDE